MDKRKILIVEDALDMRLFISTVIAANGYSPIAAKDGREGLEKAKALMPDMILLDVMMPGEGGAAMYRNLKEDQRLQKIPVCILSAVGTEVFLHQLRMINLGRIRPLPEPDGYLEKPFDHGQLIRTINRHVRPVSLP